MTPLELEAELFILAHEAGHLRSFKTGGEKWRAYFAAALARDKIVAGVDREPPTDFAMRSRAATSAGLSTEQKNLIVEEEQLAWELGKELLRSAGMQDFVKYDESTRLGVHFHRYRLGMDELWPSDRSESN